jgi:hypothetical protein
MKKFFTIMVLAFIFVTNSVFADGYCGKSPVQNHQRYHHQPKSQQQYHKQYQSRGGYWKTITEEVIIGWERVEYEDFYDWRLGPGNEYRWVKIRNGYTANVPIYGLITRRIWIEC